MQNHRKKLIWALILSESSHVFCCVLPTVFSVFSFLLGAGMIGVIPPFMVRFHEKMHEWELPIIGVSALILMAGWWIDYYAHKLDCQHMGCEHGACGPKKYKAHNILIAATGLFIVNFLIYLVFHRGLHFFNP